MIGVGSASAALVGGLERVREAIPPPLNFASPHKRPFGMSRTPFETIFFRIVQSLEENT